MNTFLIYDTNRQRVELVTSSARAARDRLKVGIRVDVWSGYDKKETIYSRTADKLLPYVAAEKEYHRQKQEAAERRNKGRRYK